jgi:hypothetical protein
VGSGDPVGPTGDVYAVFIVSKSSQYFPVVAKSVDHGATFKQVTSLTPPQNRNWGDRPFIAVNPSNPNDVYVTWDYGPSRSSISYLCAAGGSCAFKSGDLNVVIQRSTDGGRTFGPIIPINPGYPGGGGDAAQIEVEPSSGRLDVLYQGYQVLDSSYNLGPAIEYFTASTDHGANWSTPVPVGASVGTMSLAEWWINGSLAMDPAGGLYATWDTQGTSTDQDWLSFSTDHGASWSAPTRVTNDANNAPHIVQVTAGASGTAYAGVLTSASGGYLLTIRPFSTATGNFTAGTQTVSPYPGAIGVWPGDTFGLSTMSVGASTKLVLGWGSAILGAKKSSVFATTVTY